MYEIPIWFYITIAIMSAITAVQIVLYPKEWKINAVPVIMGMCIAISLLLRFVLFVKYPYFAGVDTWAHAFFIDDLVRTGHVLDSYSYAKYPIYPMINAGVMMFTGFDVKIAYALTTGIAESVLAPILVYHIGKQIFNERVALLSMLIFSTATFSIQWGIQMIPMSLGLVIFLASLYALLVTDVGKKPSIKGLVLISVLLASLILVHMIASFAYLIALLAIIIAGHMYKLIYKSRSKNARIIQYPSGEKQMERQKPLASIYIFVGYAIGFFAWANYTGAIHYFWDAVNLKIKAPGYSIKYNFISTNYVFQTLSGVGFFILFATYYFR
jgi:hypothetical protein